ncbi:MAG: hypothetical protein ACR2KH_04580 [Sphingomicrobium sp.]
MSGVFATTTLTVIVSAITSGIISIATFVIGVRMAKDQGDRGALRQVYQRLFEHFRLLRDAIRDGQPKAWPDFPRKGDRYVPLFRQMQGDGEANMLPDNLIAECEAIETAALIAGGRYRQWVRDKYIPRLRALISERALEKTGSITGRTYRELSAAELGLMTSEERKRHADELERNELGLGIQVATDRGKHDVLYVYPDTLQSATIAQLLEEISLLRSEDPDGSQLVADVQALLPRLESMLAGLRKRIRDPHPLYESILHSFRDAARA